jgi:hypothetical protein
MKSNFAEVKGDSKTTGVSRREMLRLAGATLSGLALAPIVGCTKKTKARVPLQSVDPQQLQKRLPDVTDTLLSLAERRVSDQVAIEELRKVLKESDLLAASAFGHASERNGVGQEVLIYGEGQGYLTVKMFYDDFVAPLIIKKGSQPPLLKGSQSCCISNGTKCCGDLCTDHVGDDPCPKQLTFSGRSLEISVPRVTNEERELVRGLSALLANTFTKNLTEKEVSDKSQELRDRYQNQNVFFTRSRKNEVDWSDWIIRFSNGSSMIAQVARGTASPIVTTEGATAGQSLLDSAFIDVAVQETAQGEKLIVSHLMAAS